MTERETTRLCPDCEEEYLMEVREPGTRLPVEVYCPACGFSEEVEEDGYPSEEDASEEEGVAEEELGDIEEVSREEEEFF